MNLKDYNITTATKMIEVCAEQDAAILVTICQRSKDGAIFCQYPANQNIPTDMLIQILEGCIVQIKKGQGPKIVVN